MEDLVAIFGQASKGPLGKPCFFASFEQVYFTLGEPPEDSFGIPFLLQILSLQKMACFFRVKEEGVIEKSYLQGFSFLEKKKDRILACFLPKVGEKKILKKAGDLSKNLFLLEEDFFDYLSS